MATRWPKGKGRYECEALMREEGIQVNVIMKFKGDEVYMEDYQVYADQQWRPRKVFRSGQPVTVYLVQNRCVGKQVVMDLAREVERRRWMKQRWGVHEEAMVDVSFSGFKPLKIRIILGTKMSTSVPASHARTEIHLMIKNATGLSLTKTERRMAKAVVCRLSVMNVSVALPKARKPIEPRTRKEAVMPRRPQQTTAGKCSFFSIAS